MENLELMVGIAADGACAYRPRRFRVLVPGGVVRETCELWRLSAAGSLQ